MVNVAKLTTFMTPTINKELRPPMNDDLVVRRSNWLIQQDFNPCH
jgi:hypothetical protein